ncbi:MAG: prepilin peptidase [Ruminococcus sp.]|nr:prepilin peptidase [Ruminococcus sp.]MCM1380422.1 prepilin peptidase [Muribaculaceae bacterium]MCM1478910.1 prepilin peptidase [Muribaculaceae bacterium]
MFYTDIDSSLIPYYIGVYVMVFLFGITIGSFLNVCIYRLPAGESLTKQNSHCMTCGTPIKWYDLIPVFSWLFLRGKCRACGSKISGRYILVESLTGIIFTLTFMRFDVIEQGLYYPALVCLFLAGVIVIGFEDFDTQEMTVSVLVYLVLIGLATRVLSTVFPDSFRHCPDTVVDCFIGLFSVSVPFLIFGFVLTPLVYNFIDGDRKSARKIKKRLKKMNPNSAEAKKLRKELDKHLEAIKETGPVFGFGMGDVILMAAGGLMFGWKVTVTAAFIAIIAGAVYSLVLKRKAAESETESVKAFAFGPFLAAGLGLASFFGTQLMDWYINFLTVPEIPI